MIITPFTFTFFYSYAFIMGAKSFIMIDGFISYILLMALAFGLTFILPVVMISLTKLGIVQSKTWKEFFGLAIILITIFAAIITPDMSGLTQIIVMIPLIFLYLIGFYISKSIEGKSLYSDKII